jgi:transcriptional regulator with XRE-family HTH domain
MSLGVLTEDEVAGIRAGTISNPTVDKLGALARVFGVEPGYFLDGVGEPPIVDNEALDILRDDTTSAIAQELPTARTREADDPEHRRRARERAPCGRPRDDLVPGRGYRGRTAKSARTELAICALVSGGDLE